MLWCCVVKMWCYDDDWASVTLWLFCAGVQVWCLWCDVVVMVWWWASVTLWLFCDCATLVFCCDAVFVVWCCVCGVIRLLLYSMSSTVRRLYPRSWVRSTLVCSDQNEAKMMTNFQILSCTISIAKKVGRFATDDVTSFEVLKLVFLAFYIFTHPSMQPTPEFWPKLSVSVLLKDQWT